MLGKGTWTAQSFGRTLEELEPCLLLEVLLKAFVKPVVTVTHLFVVFLAIEDLGHLVRVVVLPLSILELVTEVQHEERVLELDEDEATVDRLLGAVILIWDVIDLRVPILVIHVNFALKLFLAVLAREVLDT